MRTPWTLFAMALAACTQAPASGTYRAGPVESSRAAATSPDEPGPFPAKMGCDGVFRSGSMVLPEGGLTSVPATCTAPTTHAILAMLDNCTGQAWTPQGCDLPYGAQFCMNNVWTVLCSDDGECPAGTRCSWGGGVGRVPEGAVGWCAKTCTTGLDTECIRCDLRCDKELSVCTWRQPGYDVDEGG